MAFKWLGGTKSSPLLLVVLVLLMSSFIHGKVHNKRSSLNLRHECNDDCAARKRNMEATHSRDKMISIRTEIVKNQILQKLRLSKPPEVGNSVPLMLHQFLKTDHPSLDEAQAQAIINERISKEYYGKVESVAVLPESIQVPSNKSMYPSALLYFRLTPKVLSRNVVSAELWFRNRQNSSFLMVVSEIDNTPKTEYPKKIIGLDITVKPLSWYKMDVGPTVKNWLPQNWSDVHEIEISCKYCDINKGPIDVGDNKPVLIIRTNSSSSRSSRSTCSDSNSNGCCVEELYINFTDIGWSDWVIKPSGYYANYCKGSCINDIDRYRYYYSTVMREVITKQASVAQSLNLSLCCTPSKMSSISFIYRENEINYITTHLPNMVVEECDCA